ncbi:phosphatidylglycerophosphatase A [Legionella sp. W05-934-2]|jgi:phosphatidylglycerophosphatase A|uniref:phosphatidylglycerophosphatase A family protein n=1 Tax=Legionella sp. W05-934-2 TaxID=1198649 RepID=UPI00346276F4
MKGKQVMNGQQLSKAVWQKPSFFTAFGFGTGLSRIAPGTFGTLAALPIYALIYQFSPLVYGLICAVLFFVGIPLCGKVAKDIGIDDYKGIVWDEVVGYLVTLYMVPPSVSTLVAAFLLFRLFDILKPPPIGWVEKKVRGGFGVMFDDLLAAIPACLILHLLIWLHLL